MITVASEIMAILCLADDMKDLKERLGKIIVAYNYAGEPVTAAQLNAVGAVAALLKDAIKPNMIQTLEHTGALVHGGPFANIAHGCNSVRATKTALKPVSYTHLYSRHEQAVRRGEEKGRFEFGGSTVVVLVEPDKVVPDPDLLKNSQEGWETAVRCV